MIANRRDFLKIATTLSGAAMLAPEVLYADATQSSLSAKEESAIAELYQQEKLRGDLAIAFSQTFLDAQLLESMGKWSSSNRRAVLEELVKLYKVDLSNLESQKLLYTNDAIMSMEAGRFASTALQNRYDDLLNEGSSSIKDAYLVLTRLAVETIDMLQNYKKTTFDTNSKIKENLTYLADGSMGHYWAINQALRSLGVSRGCCEAGSAYCKTPNEYPVAYGVDHVTAPKLSQEQRHALAHMWSEEKMAHDAFEVVFMVYPHLRLFYNIGHWSEVQHLTAVEELIALYDFDVTDFTNEDGRYDAAKLRSMEAGKYAISDFEDRYNNVLLPYAVQGEMDALKLGCMVEVQDIRDLTQFLQADSSNVYINKTFEYLIAGSQSHYWAYHYALIERGESQGCCCLGGDYCKTPQEYPSGSGDRILASLWNRKDQEIILSNGRRYA